MSISKRIGIFYGNNFRCCEEGSFFNYTKGDISLFMKLTLALCWPNNSLLGLYYSTSLKFYYGIFPISIFFNYPNSPSSLLLFWNNFSIPYLVFLCFSISINSNILIPLKTFVEFFKLYSGSGKGASAF